MSLICDVNQKGTALHRLLVSLTAGFSRVCRTDSAVATVSTVIPAGLKTVEMVFDALLQLCTLLQQGVMEIRLAEKEPAGREVQISA